MALEIRSCVLTKLYLRWAGINSYNWLLPKGCRLQHAFHCDLLSRATSSTSHRPHQAQIEGDHGEYAIGSISDVKIDNWS